MKGGQLIKVIEFRKTLNHFVFDLLLNFWHFFIKKMFFLLRGKLIYLTTQLTIMK